MAQSGGGAAKRASLSGDAGGGADGLSALPDDVLVHILLLLDSAAAAGRTSVLSRRWRRLWALLPELRFPVAPAPHLIASALASHEASLRHLLVGFDAAAAAPDSAAAWLPLAARRLSGRLTIQNRIKSESAYGGETGASFQVPCFEHATAISLDLGFLSLALPPAGVLARLVKLSLERVRFAGACDLGAAVSSRRFPCLRKLTVEYARGLPNLTISSESLLEVKLWHLNGLQRLTVVAPELKKLKLANCFAGRRPVADISAPQLVVLMWWDTYDRSSVHFGDLPQLKRLTAHGFYVYGRHGYESATNRAFVSFLERFQAIHYLHIALTYPMYIGDSQCLMENLTVLPRLKTLVLFLQNKGHAFGPSLFHVLRKCTGLKRLGLSFYPNSELEAQSACPSGCVCDQPSNWKTEEVTLKRLREVRIIDLEGTDHEVAFMKRLFIWARKLKRITLTYRSISLGKMKEVREKLLCHAMPETHIGLTKYTVYE
ncbi:unnamed protein product [Urochloa decumbens]|uniref:F-box domain-containing protein n=1 Tax=Urochloa decumbens TaxID=240449 RepID=A0ABC9GDF6_9POAL